MDEKRVYDMAVQIAVAAIAADLPAGASLKIRTPNGWSYDTFEMTAAEYDYGNEKIFYAYLNGDPVVYAKVYKPWR